MKNKVALLTAVGKLEIEEQEIVYSAKSDRKVLVKMTSVGICGSDIHYFDHGGLGSFKQPMPMPMGHEPAGVVYDIGSNCGHFKVGDRVAIEPGLSCYQCSPCHTGTHNLCDHVTFMGANAPGALAEYAILDVDQLVKVSPSMTDDSAALMEPMGIAAHAFSLVPVGLGKDIAIIGAGPIGICLAIYGRMMGLNCVLIDTVPYRVDFARSMGFSACSFSEAHNTTVKFAATFDAAGTSDSFNLCTKLCAKSGVVGMIGIPTDDYISVNPHTMRVKELKIQNVRRANQTLHHCVNHFAGMSAVVDHMITHRFELEKVQEAFELVSGKKDKVVKCIIDC